MLPRRARSQLRIHGEKIMQFKRSIITGLALALCAGFTAYAGFAAAQDIKIAHVYDKTGPLEAYAKQSSIGFTMGLEYATGGKMELLGRKLVVIEKDTQNKPDVGKAQLAAAYGDDKVDI